MTRQCEIGRDPDTLLRMFCAETAGGNATEAHRLYAFLTESAAKTADSADEIIGIEALARAMCFASGLNPSGTLLSEPDPDGVRHFQYAWRAYEHLARSVIGLAKGIRQDIEDQDRARP